MELPKLSELSWALQPALVKMSINFGTTNAQRIYLALKVRSCDIISPMLCLTRMNIVAEL